MAVVTKYGKSYKDPASIALPPVVHAEGEVRSIVTGPVAIANGDSANSLIYLGSLPSNAILLPFSTLYHGAVTGVTDADIGLYKDGAVVDIDLYADGLTLATAGSKNVTAALATGGIGKRAWEVLGLANDPGVQYDLVLTLKTAATADAVVEAVILYAKK